MNTRASGSSLVSMCTSTDSSFWKEQASVSRGWKRSSAYASTSSAEAVSIKSGTVMAMTVALDGALALAANDLKGGVLCPVDEEAHVLEVELHRHRQIFDLRFEIGGTDPCDEGVEFLAVAALCLVETDPALHGFRDALGRQARLQPLPVAHVTALIRAADVRYVGRNRVLAHLDRGTVEADVGDVVLPAPIGAARHLDVDPAGELIV